MLKDRVQAVQTALKQADTAWFEEYVDSVVNKLLPRIEDDVVDAVNNGDRQLTVEYYIPEVVCCPQQVIKLVDRKLGEQSGFRISSALVDRKRIRIHIPFGVSYAN